LFYACQIIILFILFLFISCKIKRKKTRILFSIIVSIIITFEILSLYVTGKFIDYNFYSHMYLDAISTYIFLFFKQIIFFSIIFVLISFIFYYISERIIVSSLCFNKYFIPTTLMCIIIFSISGGIFNETYKVYKIIKAEEKDFDQALIDLGISPIEYITPSNITSEKGKNIIVISIESLELGFLGKDTPNLSKLSNEWTFFNKMIQGEGEGNTSASLYNHQVGMHFFFKEQANSTFQGIVSTKLTGLGHILNNAGYNSKYILGNADFAGMSDFLNIYNISTVSQDNTLGKYPTVKNGLNDYDLFQEAKLQINEFQKDSNKPFALFLSTINTHFPNGIYDKRMEEFISIKGNDLEFSVSAVDYLVNDFLTYLKEKDLLKNTAIYIFPDHKFMGATGSVYDKLSKSSRHLYLLTNVKENKFLKQTSDIINKIELPRMIIDGAEIKSNATFLADFIKGGDIQSFLKKNMLKLTTLNTASFSRKNYQKDIMVNVINNNLIVSAKDDIIVNLPITSKNEIYGLNFNSDVVLLNKNWMSDNCEVLKRGDDKKFPKLYMSISLNNEKIEKVCLGNLRGVGVCKKDKAIIFSKEEIKNLVKNENTSVSYFYNSSLMYIDYLECKSKKIPDFIDRRLSEAWYTFVGTFEEDEKFNISIDSYSKDINRFIAHAGGQIDNHIYTDSLEAMNLSYKNGFRLFELDIIKTSDNIYVAAHDWLKWAEITGYKGTLPPDRNTFKEQKIYNKYTSIDINDINKWFKNHPDAILVTDKVNTPLDFSSKFIDKNRLMMELFTWDAVKEGIKANIKSSMPTGSILKQINGNKIAYLKNLGITDISSSMKIINYDKDFVKDIVNAGIHIYAFHLHVDEEKDEKYIICKERNYFYGMYADKFDFKDIIDCRK
jgi:glycerophosphoryl diester phosphodiesterase